MSIERMKTAKLSYTKRSFSAGELSPHLCQSRTDMPLYSQCFSKSVNVIPLKTGALIHRPNTLSFPELALPFGASRLIPFYIAGDTHILLVFGSETLTFVLIEGGRHPKVIETVPTVYAHWDAPELDYAISGNVMVLVHRDHPPYQIRIMGQENSEFSQIEFSPPPWLGERIIAGSKSNAKLTVHAEPLIPSEPPLGGVSKVVANASVFRKEDIGRHLRLGFLPSSWKSKTFYAENSYISMHGKVYKNVMSGLSGLEWVENMAATFIADGSTQWKVVYSSQTISSGSKGTGKDSSTPSVSVGVVPSYYVWGTIKSFYTDREVCIELHAPCTFSHDPPVFVFK